MGAKELGVQSDAGDPFGYQPGVLPCCHALTGAASAREQEFAGLLACGFQIVVDGLTGLIGQLELDRPAGFLLPYRCAVDGISVRCNVFDLEGDDIAAAQLAVDGEIEHGEVAGSSLDQQSGSD